ncbi:four helix bundle protein [Candidatus Falkowbacteria bacterium]|nr:four helix bundle protein [Candidatus Falkowbacteria bacterium]
MTEGQKVYYGRFVKFAVNCARVVAKFDWRVPGNREWGSQLIRFSGSVCANYIEAVEGLSDADFIYRYRICCKESNESVNWLFLLKSINEEEFYDELLKLIKEGLEFSKMFKKSIDTKKKNIEKKKNNK